MSSGTSTRSEALQPWQLFTLAGLVGATIVVALSQGESLASVTFLSLTIFTAAAVGVAAWRALFPLANPDELTTGRGLGERTRVGLEREKALVLRTIKELEFDHAMGKLSAQDFDEMSTRLRLRAARLIQQLDASGGYRDAIQREIERRLGTPSATAQPDAPSVPAARMAETRADAERDEVACVACGAPNAVDAKFCTSCGAPRREQHACVTCRTVNDSDARFCKACGGQMGNPR